MHVISGLGVVHRKRLGDMTSTSGMKPYRKKLEHLTRTGRYSRGVLDVILVQPPRVTVQTVLRHGRFKSKNKWNEKINITDGMQQPEKYTNGVITVSRLLNMQCGMNSEGLGSPRELTCGETARPFPSKVYLL